MLMKTKANLACKEQAAYRGSKLFQMFCTYYTAVNLVMLMHGD